MSTIDLNKDTFQTSILDSKPLIVDFWAPWCGPCRNFAPVFEEASEQHEDVVFAKVNTEEEQELAAGLKIRSIPTLMVLDRKITRLNSSHSCASLMPSSSCNKIFFFFIFFFFFF